MSKLDDYIAGLLSEDMAWEGDAEQVEQLERCRRELVEVMGFTWDDVAMLREEAKRYWMLADPENYGAAEEAAARDRLADRIEALLPPEEADD
jgi:hypothetical protein